MNVFHSENQPYQMRFRGVLKQRVRTGGRSRATRSGESSASAAAPTLSPTQATSFFVLSYAVVPQYTVILDLGSAGYPSVAHPPAYPRAHSPSPPLPPLSAHIATTGSTSMLLTAASRTDLSFREPLRPYASLPWRTVPKRVVGSFRRRRPGQSALVAAAFAGAAAFKSCPLPEPIRASSRRLRMLNFVPRTEDAKVTRMHFIPSCRH